MKVACPSENPVSSYKTTSCHHLEDHNVNNYRREDLKEKKKNLLSWNPRWSVHKPQFEDRNRTKLR
jgi:hypothetical protein